MRIKVCGMRAADNLRDLLQLNPDYVGFIYYQGSPRYVNEAPQVKWPDSVKRVGVFVDEDRYGILKKVLSDQLHAVQLHGSEAPDYCRSLQVAGLEVIKAVTLTENFDFHQLEPYKGCVDYFLFDAPGPARGGNGVPFNWDLLRQYDQQVPWFLSGGISPWMAEAVTGEWLRELQPYGIDLNSRFEISPGIKNIPELQRFMGKVKLESELSGGQ